MSRSASRLLLALILLMLGSATCAFSGAGPIDPHVRDSAQHWPLLLQLVADLLTIPIQTSDIADIRDVVLVIAAGAVLLFLSFISRRDRPLPAPSGAERYIVRLGLVLILLAFISAIANDRFELARGWIVRLVCGLTWALAIARFMTIDRARHLIRLILALGGVILVLAIAHRANRGVAHFSWPIGPITITAAMAGLWACIAIVWLVIHLRSRRSAIDVVLSAIVAAISMYCLWETGRRSAALGLVAGLVVAPTVYLWISLNNRRARSAILCGVHVVVIAAFAYVINQAASPMREKSGPVALRLAYWRESAALISEHPLLGIGPDCFIVDMTSRIAPLRAVSPHFYHGSIDPYAHNEWLQAIVELGIPGGLAYLALPIVAVLLASRSVRNPARSDIALVSIAGLAAICCNEFASINLRESILPIWYWTLLGLAMAVPHGDAAMPEVRAPLQWIRFVPIGFGLVLIGLAGFDLSASSLQALKTSKADGRYSSRLYARKTLAAQAGAARLALNAAFADASRGFDLPCHLLSKLYELAPGYPNVSSSYANCLLRAGKHDRAEKVLREALSDRGNQFEPAANLLYESTLAYPVEKLRCVQRSLRAAALDARLQEILLQISVLPAVQTALAAELPAARLLAAQKSAAEFAGAAIELLRINAFIKSRSGETAEAISDQRLAVDCYRKLEQTDNLYRRRAEAEVDAFYTLAQMIYEHDLVNYRQAFNAIREAERYAVLGIGHEWVSDRQPGRGFVIGEVMPTEFPERLRPMWRLSALLGIVKGVDRDLDFRVYFSLPPHRWTPADLSVEMARLARTAYDDLGKIPENKRPAHYHLLPDMIRRYDAKAVEHSSPPTN